MAVKLPAAAKLASSKLQNTGPIKRKIEKWINEKLMPAVLSYKPQIDLKKRIVTGYVAVECPSDYYGNEGFSKNEWVELYESIILPLGYTPIYTYEGGGLYDMVGVKWCVPL